MIWLDDLENLSFPDHSLARPDGLLAVGGDASPERLLAAYRQGIFPWPYEDLPLLWFSPDPRFVLPIGALHISRSLRREMRRQPYEIRFDRRFTEVMRGCATARRRGQSGGTWITEELIEGYQGLFEWGYAHSAEAYLDGTLVGGLYGVAIGDYFCGESMFALEKDASKIAFITLVAALAELGYTTIDCQVHTDHLARFGAEEIPRAVFLDHFLVRADERLHIGSLAGKEPSPEEALTTLDAKRAAAGPFLSAEGRPGNRPSRTPRPPRGSG